MQLDCNSTSLISNWILTFNILLSLKIPHINKFESWCKHIVHAPVPWAEIGTEFHFLIFYANWCSYANQNGWNIFKSINRQRHLNARSSQSNDEMTILIVKHDCDPTHCRHNVFNFQLKWKSQVTIASATVSTVNRTSMGGNRIDCRKYCVCEWKSF